MVNQYALAHNLIGFRATTLRVIVRRVEGANVWITTADLLDVGTKLVLDAKQIEVLDESAPTTVIRHRDGLVAFA